MFTRDTTRQPATIARLTDRKMNRAAKSSTASEAAASFAAFAKTHNAMIARRAGA